MKTTKCIVYNILQPNDMNLGVHERESTREDEKKADKAGKDTVPMVEATVVTSATKHTHADKMSEFSFGTFQPRNKKRNPEEIK